MKGLLRTILLFCLGAALTPLHAQEDDAFAGVWKGILRDAKDSFQYTMRITHIADGEVTATGLSGNNSFFCETRMTGRIDNGILRIQETEVIRTNYTHNGICLLELEVLLGNHTLTGSFRPVSNDGNCLRGRVKLSQPYKNDSAKTPLTLPSPKKKQPSYSERTLSLVREIRIDAEEAEILVFDNGVVDGDMITLTDNKEVVFSHAPLSTIPIKHTISNKSTATHEIAFVADNLGSVPPNAGLLVIVAKGQRWEVPVSSDLTKTAYVRIVLRHRNP